MDHVFFLLEVIDGATRPTYGPVFIDISTLYGNAYQRTTETTYLSTFLRRHAAFGAAGLGAIYTVDATTGMLNGNFDIQGVVPANGGAAIDFAAGLNHVNISAAELNTSGLLYYKLETSSFSDTKRMVLLNN